jgi:hypothetical protein
MARDCLAYWQPSKSVSVMEPTSLKSLHANIPKIKHFAKMNQVSLLRQLCEEEYQPVPETI